MRHVVTDADSAAVLGTGDVSVLATSRLITWMEAATVQVAAQFVAPGQTTVGTAVRVEHRRATPVGDRVEVIAKLPSSAAGRRLTFSVQAFGHSGEPIAAGEIDRVIVDREAFLQSATSQADHRSLD